MDIEQLMPHVEALVFASDKPLTSPEITELVNQAFGFMEDKIMPEQVDAAIEGIVEKYTSEFYPFEVKQSGGGWQFLLCWIQCSHRLRYWILANQLPPAGWGVPGGSS